MAERQTTLAEERLRTRTSQWREVALSDLRLDGRFQRLVNPNQVSKIKAEFHPQGIGSVLAMRIEGQAETDPPFALGDGQQRYHALVQIQQEIQDGARQPDGFRPTVMAEVFDEPLSSDEAAALFRLRNQQKPIPTGDRDRIAVVEGDETMVELVDQAHDAGYVVFDDDPEEVSMTARTEGKQIIRLGAKKGVNGLLTRALTVQARAFETPGGKLQGTLHPKVLLATAKLMVTNPHLEDEVLTTAMAQMGLPALTHMVNSTAEKTGSRVEGAARTTLVDLYNKGRRGKERIKR
jgi:hypothetical protein